MTKIFPNENNFEEIHEIILPKFKKEHLFLLHRVYFHIFEYYLTQGLNNQKVEIEKI